MALTELATGSWTIDASRTVITATAKMMSAASVPATFTVVSGTISVTDGQLSSVEVVADAKSYTSSIGKRNRDVTSQKGLLDANNYPTITFTAAGGDEHVMSVETVQRFKPHPTTYQYAAEQLDVPIGAITMVAAHDWDVNGAMLAGANAAFIERPGAAKASHDRIPELVAPDIVGLAALLTQGTE